MKHIIITYFIIQFAWFPSFSQEYPNNIILRDYTLEFSNTDSIDFPNYYNNKKQRDSLTRIYGNWHSRAKNMENILIEKSAIKIDRDNVNRIVYLKNGNKKVLSPDLMIEEVEYTLDKTFKEFECLLFRIQWYEGNNYCLVDWNSGESIKMFGKPYFSTNGKFIISINEDIEAGYSYNGFQLFKYENNKFENIWEYQANEWGPSRIKWITENEIIIENHRIEVIDDIWNNIYFYKILKIKKNKP